MRMDQLFQVFDMLLLIFGQLIPEVDTFLTSGRIPLVGIADSPEAFTFFSYLFHQIVGIVVQHFDTSQRGTPVFRNLIIILLLITLNFAR